MDELNCEKCGSDKDVTLQGCVQHTEAICQKCLDKLLEGKNDEETKIGLES